MNILLLLIVIGFFYWIFRSSKVPPHIHKSGTLTFEDVAYSEYGYLTAMLGKLAKVDGRISELEAELISNILDDMSAEFANPTLARTYLKEVLKEEKERHDNIGIVAQGFYDRTKHTPHKQIKVMEFLINLAFIDGVLHAKERSILMEVGAILRINITELERIFHDFERYYHAHQEKPKYSVKERFALLEIEPTQDIAAVKKAYKRVVKKYHPDIVRGSGGTHEEILQANEKLQAINDAYEAIKKELGH